MRVLTGTGPEWALGGDRDERPEDGSTVPDRLTAACSTYYFRAVRAGLHVVGHDDAGRRFVVLAGRRAGCGWSPADRCGAEGWVEQMSDGSGTGAEAQRAGEDEDLRSSVAGLAGLGSIRLPLAELLTRVAGLAVQAIPGADGAGLTLLEEDRSELIVTTADFVAEIDSIQYGIGQGPCITAAAEARTVISGSLGADVRWRRFGGRIARLGVHSVVSLPLLTPDGVVGAMNVYAHAKHAFDERAAALGEVFAAPAAIAVQNAQVLEQTRRLAAQLQSALDHRMVVERAIGIIMSRSGVTEDEALQRLRTLSQHEHTKLGTVAQTLIDEAVRRARAQHQD
jgi:GAF domain-containing protein